MQDMRLGISVVAAGVLLSVAVGCIESKRSLTYLGESDLEYYKDTATEIVHPHMHEDVSSEASLTQAPRRIRHPRKDEIRELPLMVAIHMALANNKILIQSNQFLSPQSALLTNPAGATSVYDSALQETGVLTGGRGVEAALGDFDTQFTTIMNWGRNETVQNNRFISGGLAPGDTLVDETAAFQSRLDKQLSYGALLSLRHDWNYSQNNIPSRLFTSSNTGILRAEYRQPLWAGAGAEFTRINGPVRSAFGSGVDQGVVIARINNDISLADFQASVRNMLKDVEDTYWELFLAYRTYDAEVLGRNSSLGTWREVKAKFDTGQASAADEAQARDNYYESRSRTENALADLYSSEGRMRRMMGLTVNDGEVLRPADEPLTAEFSPDWHLSLAEALTRRVELRRQKWSIKSLMLQLKAANSLTKPRLDFVSGYQRNAFGDHLLGGSDFDGVSDQGFSNAYETLSQGNQTGWDLGFEFSTMLGNRTAHAQVRNVELRIAKARAALATQELEVSHELSNAFQGLDRWYATAQTNLNRRQAAERRVRSFEAEYRAGRPNATLDLVLRAQSSLAQSEIAYYRSLTEYSKAIADIHYRKGTLLEHNNVHLSEGLWEPEAYDDALRRAWARSAAFESEKLYTEPSEFEAGVVIGSAGVVLPDGHPLLNNVDNDADNNADNNADNAGGDFAPTPVPAPVPAIDSVGDSFGNPVGDDDSLSFRGSLDPQAFSMQPTRTSFGDSRSIPKKGGAKPAIRSVSYESTAATPPPKAALMRTNGGTRIVPQQTVRPEK